MAMDTQDYSLLADNYSIDQSFGDGSKDATSHIQSIINIANIANVGVYIPTGIYKITSPIENIRRLHLAEGAILTAAVPMSAVIRTQIGTRFDGGYIIGKGTIDANTNAAIGIHLRDFLYFNISNIIITGGNTAAIKLGDTGSSGRSAEAILSQLRLITNSNVVAGSIGILFENSGDHSLSQIIIMNYETGMKSPTTSCNAVVHDVHSWCDPAKGVLKTGFEDHSNGSHYTACHADSPTQYGWRIYGYNTTFVQSGTYLNPAVSQIADNTVVGIRFESTNSVATIIGHFFEGGSSSLRLANDIQTIDSIYTNITKLGCVNSNVVNSFTKSPSLTYSRATENTAQTQIRTALVSLGLVTDSTTA